MAIDTKSKRMSMLNFGDGTTLHLLPEPDGAVDGDDRQHLLDCYSGIAFGAPVITTPPVQNPLGLLGPTLGPAVPVIPFAFAPLIFVRPSLNDPWQAAPEMEFVSATAAASGIEMGTLTIRRRYGFVKHPHEPAGDPTFHPAIDLDGFWVFVAAFGETGVPQIFFGRIASDVREIHRNDIFASGMQTWVAHEPIDVLRRISVARSYWFDESLERDLGWVPGMNYRDDGGVLIGNRTASRYANGVVDPNGVHLYGGTSWPTLAVWSRLQYIEYLLARFATTDDMTWQVTGETGPLAEQRDVVQWGVTQTLDQMLSRLIERKNGLDFVIRWSEADDTLSVHVYALSSATYTFAGATLPRNTDSVTITAGADHDIMRVRVSKTDTKKYGKIRVVGKRIVVTLSIYTPGVGAVVNKKWGDTLEDEYNAGTGDDDDALEKQALARQSDRFETVYQRFGVADNWGFNGGSASPKFDLNGVLQAGAEETNRQRVVRRTLARLPFEDQLDYEVGTIIGLDEDHKGDQLPPQCWLLDRSNKDDVRYVTAASKRCAVRALRNEWGLHLDAGVNHRLAKGEFVVGDGTAPTDTDPEFDYTELAMTFAFEFDQRIELGYEIPGWTEADGVLVIAMPDAECWYVAPDTIFQIDTTGQPVFVNGGDKKVLRNDAPRMAQVMAGALARYSVGRVRAEVVFRGIVPYTDLIGHMLTIRDEGGDVLTFDAPITSVQYVGGDAPTTTVKAGFAK